MVGRTHDVAAFTALLMVLVYHPNIPQMTLLTAVVAFSANFIGGLFPDIDQRTSDFWDNFRLGPFVSRFITPLLGGHRNLSHSLVGLTIIGAVSAAILQYTSTILLLDINMEIVWYAFMIGVISHLIMDSITKDGLPLLWPLKFKIGFPPVKFLRVRADSWVEKLIIFPGLILYTIYLVYTNQDLLLTFIKHNIR